jgi:hypothetical protein
MITSRTVVAIITPAEHDRLKAVAQTHGIPNQELTKLAVLSYLEYLENGQWAACLPIDLIQPSIDAARAAGLSIPAWLEATLREILKRPVEVKTRSTGPRGRPPAKAYHFDNPTIFCRCGCGKTLLQYDRAGRPRQYIQGHWLSDYGRKLRRARQTDSGEGS